MSNLCLICGASFDLKKRLANHVQSIHDISSRDYTVSYLCGGTAPRCAVPGCDLVPRYTAFSFRDYCIEHVSRAYVEGGRKGGSVCGPKGVHREIGEWLSSIGVVTESHVRSLVPLDPTDLWIPSASVVVACCDLSVPGEGGDKRRYVQKSQTCAAFGVRLLQFFSDEWSTRRSVCQSMIVNALGRNELRLNARDCSLVDVSVTDARAFQDATHVAGHVRSTHRLGLCHPKHGLVALMSLRRPIQKKWGDVLEIARMSFASGTTVRGAASRLAAASLAKALSEGREGLLSYADLRFGTGAAYERCGFELVTTTTMNYWYTDGVRRMDRFRFRAQQGLSEKEYAALHGVRPVYGAGNAVYLKKPERSDA